MIKITIFFTLKSKFWYDLWPLFPHLPVYLTNGTFREWVQSRWEEFSREVVMISAQEKPHLDKIRQFYLSRMSKNSQEIPKDSNAILGLTHLITDKLFLLDTLKTARAQADKSPQVPVYLYYYNRPGPSLVPLMREVELGWENLPILGRIIWFKYKEWWSQTLSGVQPSPYGKIWIRNIICLWQIWTLSNSPSFFPFKIKCVMCNFF